MLCIVCSQVNEARGIRFTLVIWYHSFAVLDTVKSKRAFGRIA